MPLSLEAVTMGPKLSVSSVLLEGSAVSCNPLDDLLSLFLSVKSSTSQLNVTVSSHDGANFLVPSPAVVLSLQLCINGTGFIGLLPAIPCISVFLLFFCFVFFFVAGNF